MNPKLEYIFSAILIVVAAALVLFVTAIDKKTSIGQTCEGVEVQIAEPWHFVTEEQIKNYVCEEFGNCIGMNVDSLNLSKIEELVDSKSAVLKSQAWCTPDRILHIDVTQRKPVARFQTQSCGIYVDDRACFFPLQKNYTAQVPIIDGDIPLAISGDFKGEIADSLQRKWAEGVINMIRCLKSSPVWSENISQISVIEGDIVMIPREGKERFIFGSPYNAEAKFAKMEKYYTHIAPSKEKGWYTSVDVKYHGQIICRQ